MQIFHELGRQVEILWRDKGYNEDDFAAISEAALRDGDLPAKISAWEIVSWALGETNLPQQRDLPAKFGDPPITLYNSPRFHIDIYFWLEGTTEIHQHGFCGAFFPHTQLPMKLITKGICPTAITNALIVMKTFIGCRSAKLL